MYETVGISAAPQPTLYVDELKLIIATLLSSTADF